MATATRGDRMKNRHRQWASIRQLRAAVAALSIEQRERVNKLLTPPDRTAYPQRVRVSAGIEVNSDGEAS